MLLQDMTVFGLSNVNSSICGYTDSPGTLALTFDDGPSEYTTQLESSDVLEEDKGSVIDKIIHREELKSGHQIASHTFNHPVISKMPIEELKREVLLTEEAISQP